MEPTTAEGWIAVANERAADAEAIEKDRPASVGSVYMAGYAIECSLKALLQKRGIPTPTSGSKGHNLHELWRASGLQFSELKDSAGTQTFFLQYWNTSWRYENRLPFNLGYTVKELVTGARQLNGFLQRQTRDSKKQRRR